MPTPTASVKIVGAGFSGLTAAYFLAKRGVPVEIFEAESEVGGLIRTRRRPEGLVETAANGVLSSALFEEVAEDVGVELIPARRESRKRYIWRAGRGRRWPLGFLETLGALWRFFRAGRAAGGRAPRSGETIKEWGDRVFGPPFTDRLLAPALQGIYAGDEKRLSASLILGRFFEPKSSVPKRKSRLKGTVAPKEGMGAFQLALRAWLEERGVRFHLGSPLSADVLAKNPGPWILCTGAPAAARLLAQRAPDLSQKIASTEMIPIATVTMFYPPSEAWLPGFGCLFPRAEPFSVLGILFNTFIFENRGPAYSETWIFRDEGLSDSLLSSRIREERRRLAGVDAKTLAFEITRWPEALPHYTLALERALPDIERGARAAGVTLLGNYLGRLSLSRMLERTKETCEALAENWK